MHAGRAKLGLNAIQWQIGRDVPAKRDGVSIGIRCNTSCVLDSIACVIEGYIMQ